MPVSDSSHDHDIPTDTASATPLDALAWMTDDLVQRDTVHRRRRLIDARPEADGYVRIDGRRLLNLSGNDYLGLAADLDVSRALADWLGEFGAAANDAGARRPFAGATASRLVVGNHPGYVALEADLARHKGVEAALVFGSGYQANVGVIQALAGRDDTVFSDRLNHASIVDGIVLSRATHRRYRHGDLAQLDEMLRQAPTGGRRLIVTDSIFSMDGDVAPLAGLVELKERHGAMLLVDDAHGGGVFGEHGEGVVAALGLSSRVDAVVGTFSKAWGVYGAYVAGRRILVDYLTNHARGLIYSTALPPVVVALVRQALIRVREDGWRRQRLWSNLASFHAALAAHGLPVAPLTSPILPLLIGSDSSALSCATRLRELGYATIAIRPPTVPEHTARLRLSLSAAHDPRDLEAAAAAIASTLHALRESPG